MDLSWIPRAFSLITQRPRLEVILYPLTDPNGFVWPCVRLIAHNGTFGILRIEAVVFDEAGMETRLDLRTQEHAFPKGGVVTPEKPWSSTLHYIRGKIEKGTRLRIEIQLSDGNWKYSRELDSASVYVRQQVA